MAKRGDCGIIRVEAPLCMVDGGIFRTTGTFYNQLKIMNETPESKSTETRSEQAKAASRPEYGTFGEAVDAGRQAAEQKAKEAMPKLKGAFEGAIQDIAYGGAFGVCFAAYFARELVPEDLRSNVSKGMKRGRNAAKAAVDELRPRSEADSAPPPIVGGA